MEDIGIKVLEKTAVNQLTKLTGNAFEWISGLLKEKKVNPSAMDPVYLDMSRCKALIAFVSSGRAGPLETAARYAIDFHYRGRDGESKTNRLQHVWLIHTPRSEADARQLRAYLEDKSIQCALVALDENRDIDNAKCIKDKIDGILAGIEQYDIPLNEVAIDITGGSISVSIGMLSACMTYGGLQLQLMVVDDQDKGPDGRPREGARTLPRKIELQYQR